MKTSTILPSIALAAMLAGCSTMKVKTEASATYDFSTVKTYAWVQAPQKILDEDDTYLNEDMQTALGNELAARGWKQADSPDRADLQVVYFIKLREHEEYTTPPESGESQVSSGFTYNRNDRKWGVSDNAPNINVYTVEIGTLSLLIDDAKSSSRLWSGSLQMKLDRSRPIEKQRETLRKVARKLTSRIP